MVWSLTVFFLAFGLAIAGPVNPQAWRRDDPSLSARADDPRTACPGYTASNIVKTDSSLTADLTLAGAECNVYGKDIKDLKLLVEYQTNERLHVNIYDAALQVYQVHEDVLPRPPNNKAASSDAALQFDIVEKPFSFKVTRKENKDVLFDSSAASLIFETEYARLRTSLPLNPNLYGLGEHTDGFRLPTQNYERVFFNSESPYIPTKSNLYGTHPVYFEHRLDKGTHGVFLLNSDPMAINITTDGSNNQYLEYNLIGGVFDLYFMAGKGPADVSKQYAEIAGFPAMIPYWTLGFHQCRYGYFDVFDLAETVANYSSADIPLETIWSDIDHMDYRKDFTLDPLRFNISKMREFVDTIHKRDQHYVVILDAGVKILSNYSTYVRGHEQSVFLKTNVGTDYRGVQWPGVVAWPDWLKPATQDWWTNEFKEFFSADKGVDIDAIWVDMDEASNFCHDINCKPEQTAIDEKDPPEPKQPPRPYDNVTIPGFPDDFSPPKSTSTNKRDVDVIVPRQNNSTGDKKGLPDREWNHPKFYFNNHRARGWLSNYTIYTNITNYDGTYQYDTHNFYGATMAYASREAMIARRPSKRPFVLTRSTFAGAGSKVTHWFGDNNSSWWDFRITIPQMLAFTAMHQMPMVGSDVCGFNGNTDEFLCARWALLGAFQPFYRNHAEESTIRQEFYRWPTVIEAAKKAIDARYKLLDYIYTAFYYQTTTGVPLINSLWYLYPNDNATTAIETQWFYGDAILVSPVTQDYSDRVDFYLPNDIFYDFWTHEKVTGEGKEVTKTGLKATEMPVHIRGGTIIPMRANSANTTKALREENFDILVAPGKDGKASGRLYLDDGESLKQDKVSEITFQWDGKKFSTSGKSFDYKGTGSESITVDSVVILAQDDGDKKVEGPWKLDGPWDFSV